MRLSPALATALPACGLLLHACAPPARPSPAATPAFAARELSDEFWTESIAAGDLDRDGNVDLVTGPFWWRGPDLAQRHEIRAARTYPIDDLADSFLAFVEDVDHDGWLDVVEIGLPGTAATWYRNPGAPQLATSAFWDEHLLWADVGMESPALADLDGDGHCELVCASDGFLVWLGADALDPRQPWRPHPISAVQAFPTYTHGLGIGDVNGDGRADVVVASGWFEQPASLGGDPPWPSHPFAFGGGRGGAQMLVVDVDGDGDADVVTAIDAHGYGLSWFEQVPAALSAGGTTFVEHVIQAAQPDPRDPHQFTQPHALARADVDGDGLPDVVTGKRFWAHHGEDPGAREPAVLYWFQLVRAGGVRFVPHRVDDDSGVGLQVLAQDLDGDGRTDLASANKKGIHVFLRAR